MTLTWRVTKGAQSVSLPKNPNPFGKAPNRNELKVLPPMMLGMLGAGLILTGILFLQQSAKMFSNRSYTTPFQRTPNSRPRKWN